MIDFDAHPIARLLNPKLGGKSRGARLIESWFHEPEQCVQDLVAAKPEEYQSRLLGILRPGTKKRMAMKSAHGVGKSAGHSMVGWTFLVSRPFPRLVATAPTKAQLTDALWPEYAKWHGRMADTVAGKVIAPLFDISEGHIRMNLHPKAWFAVSRTSNRPENVQGFHGDHILIQVDEASAVPQPVFEVLEGALSNAEFEDNEVLLLLTGNPNFTSGEFYDAFTKNKELYERLTVTGDPATKFDEKVDGETFVSRRVTKKYADNMARKYGRDSAVYDVRVRGLFPRNDDRAVIPLKWAQRARYVQLPTFDAASHPVKIVLDVARGGGDKTTVGSYRGNHMIKMVKRPLTSGPECEDMVVDEIAYWTGLGLQVGQVIVDEPGVGGPVLDGLRRRGVPADGYHGGKGLSAAQGDPEDDVRMFLNRRARDWWGARRLFERGQFAIAIEDEELIEEIEAELASVRYDYNQQEKIQVESKKDMRARLGDGASPDLADNIIMALARSYSTAGAMSDMMPADVELALEAEDRATVEAQTDMETLW